MSILFPVRWFNRLMMAVLLVTATTVSAQPKPGAELGWEPLFNGRDLSGWVTVVRGQSTPNLDPDKIVQVHDGMIHMYHDAVDQSKQAMAYVATTRDYADYHLRLEYKWGTKKFAPRGDKRRDAGILYHVFGEDTVWPTSIECQIQEGDTGKIFAVRTKVGTTVDPKLKNPRFLPAEQGGVVSVIGDGLKPCGISANADNEKEGWNRVEVIVRGDTAIHIVNGKTNNVVLSMLGLVGGQWRPLKKGRILLQAEDSEVFYRNVEIRSLVGK